MHSEIGNKSEEIFLGSSFCGLLNYLYEEKYKKYNKKIHSFTTEAFGKVNFLIYH